MTNKEKREYLSQMTLHGAQCFSYEITRRNQLLTKVPDKFYKFRKFDKFSFDMLNNGYVYLAPAGKLDDPFDCLVDTSFESIYCKNTANLTKNMMRFIVRLALSHSANFPLSVDEVVQIIDDSTVDGHIERDKLFQKIECIADLTNEQKDFLYNNFANVDSVLDGIAEDDGIKDFILNMIKSKDTVGVCSFSTCRDNKVMWSHYSNCYKGYCIEYKIKNKNQIMHNFLPVVYKRNINNNITVKLIEFAMENIVRNLTAGEIPTNIGSFNELLCTKDKDWAYQSEWRLIGDANARSEQFVVERIYLGFDVSVSNEKKIVNCAKKNKFNVYKMNKPTGTTHITYKKIC